MRCYLTIEKKMNVFVYLKEKGNLEKGEKKYLFKNNHFSTVGLKAQLAALSTLCLLSFKKPKSTPIKPHDNDL